MTLYNLMSLQGNAELDVAVALGITATFPVEEGRLRMLLEADPDGGVLAARYKTRLRLDRSLVEASSALRHGWDRDAFVACSRELWPGLPVIPGSTRLDQIHGAFSAGDAFAAALAAGDADIVTWLGRPTPTSPALPLMRRGTVNVVLARTTLESIELLRCRVRELDRAGVELQLVAVGPYQRDDPRPGQVAGELGIPLIGELPHDPKAIDAFTGDASGKRLAKSTWWRSVREVATVLSAQGRRAPAPPAPTPAPVNAAPSAANWRPAPTAPARAPRPAAPTVQPLRGARRPAETPSDRRVLPRTTPPPTVPAPPSPVRRPPPGHADTGLRRASGGDQ